MTNGEASRKKRKAEQMSADEDAAEDANDADNEGAAAIIPHLPAPVWGRVLDFMPYGEVRSALLVGKHVAAEAVKYVQTLNIMKSSQMYIPAVRRFANAGEVNILCLLDGTGERIGEEGPEQFFTISLDVANRSVPFLAGVPRIKRGFVGGLITTAGMSYRQVYEADACSGPRDHGDIFRSLMTAHSGAVKTGALPNGLVLEGIHDCLYDLRPCRERSVSCQWCRDILLHFPLRDLFPFLVVFHDGDADFCLTKREAWSVVSQRSDISKGLKENSEEQLSNYVFVRSSFSRPIEGKQRAAAVEQLPEKWRVKARTCRFIKVRYLTESSFEELDFLIEKGLDPKLIQRELILKRFCRTNAFSSHEFIVWSRTTVEKLVAHGFPINCESFPVISETFFSKVNQRGI